MIVLGFLQMNEIISTKVKNERMWNMNTELANKRLLSVYFLCRNWEAHCVKFTSINNS